MSIFDEWAQYAVEILKAESTYAGGMTEHGTLIGDAREALVQMVLSRILPSAYEIGRGQVVDSQGNKSKQIDIVIARRDSPALTLLSGAKIYLVESVLATIEVKSKLAGGPKSTLFDALDNCASVVDLMPQVDGKSLAPLKQELEKKDDEPNSLTNLKKHRYELNGRPATYIYGFTGYKESYTDLAQSIQNWWVSRHEELQKEGKNMAMRHIPSLVTCEGCFATRNAAPFELPFDPDKQTCLGYVGKEETSLRMLIAHLLITLHSKTPWSPDLAGLKMEPRVYIEQMKTYNSELGFLCDKPAPEAAVESVIEG
jgi:hypothetical protein